MPNPAKFKSKKHFMSECMRITKQEGKTREQSLGQCLNMWRQESEDKKSVATILKECAHTIKDLE